MASLLDAVLFNPTLGGTTDWVVSSAVQGYLTPTASGAVNGKVYYYRAESADLSQWEEGFGTWSSGTSTLTRTTVVFNSAGTTAKINFSSAPQVGIVAASAMILAFDDPMTLTAAQRLQARRNISAPLAGSLTGLELAPPGSTTSFSIFAGECADSTAADNMVLASAYTKTTGAWAVGSGNGSLDTGSITNTTGYHVFVIKRPDTGVVDVLVSLSATAPTLPTNYTLFRRIGSIRTDGSGNWFKQTQVGDQVFYSAPFGDHTNINTTTTPAAYALTVPSGVVVQATVRILAGNTAGQSTWIFYSPNEGTQAANSPPGNETHYTTGASTYFANQLYITVNTSRQIMGVSQGSTNNQVWIVTTGYVDRRGRDG